MEAKDIYDDEDVDEDVDGDIIEYVNKDFDGASKELVSSESQEVFMNEIINRQQQSGLGRPDPRRGGRHGAQLCGHECVF